MRVSPEYVMKLTDRVIRAKQELALAQAEWDHLFSAPGQMEITLKEKSVSSDSHRGRVLALLQQSPLEKFDATTIANMFNMNLGTTRTTLSKLVAVGLIEKRGLGSYGACQKMASINDFVEKEANPEEKAS